MFIHTIEEFLELYKQTIKLKSVMQLNYINFWFENRDKYKFNKKYIETNDFVIKNMILANKFLHLKALK
jgi:hypothetical protein